MYDQTQSPGEGLTPEEQARRQKLAQMLMQGAVSNSSNGAGGTAGVANGLAAGLNGYMQGMQINKMMQPGAGNYAQASGATGSTQTISNGGVANVLY